MQKFKVTYTYNNQVGEKDITGWWELERFLSSANEHYMTSDEIKDINIEVIS